MRDINRDTFWLPLKLKMQKKKFSNSRLCCNKNFLLNCCANNIICDEKFSTSREILWFYLLSPNKKSPHLTSIT